MLRREDPDLGCYVVAEGLLEGAVKEYSPKVGSISEQSQVLQKFSY